MSSVRHSDVSFSMRLFVAAQLPGTVKNSLRRIQEQLPPGDLTKTHDFHLTLMFLGECTQEQRGEIEQALRTIFYEPFEAELGNIGTFGSPKFPRVVWIALHIPASGMAMIKKIHETLKPLGFTNDHEFSPHITLARIKRVDDKAGFMHKLKEVAVEPHSFSIDRFFLFESRLDATRPVHIKLAEFPAVNE